MILAWASPFNLPRFCALWQYRDLKKPEVGTIAYSYRLNLRVFYSAENHEHITKRSVAHFRTLNSLKYHVFAALIANI